MSLLGEITSIRGDAAIGAGTAPGYDLAQLQPATALAATLDSAAAARAEANKYAMEQRQKNLKSYYDNFNTMDVTGLMEKDYPLITTQWAKLASDMANSYDVIENPWKDQQRYADLKNRETALRGQIAESKQHKALRDDYQRFISQHKDFETPQNIAMAKQFSNGVLGQRDPGMLLNPLPAFDVAQESIARQANLAAQQKLKEETTKSPWMTTTEQTRYLESAYDDAVKALIGGQDAYGRPMTQAVGDAFNAMPDQVKQQYTRPDGSPDLEGFAVQALYGPFRNQDSAAVTQEANPFALISARGAEERRNMRLAASLNKENLDAAVSQTIQHHLDTISAPDKPGANIETVQVKTTPIGPATYQDWDVAKVFKPRQDIKTEEIKGVKLPMDTWSINAYSIPGPKVKTYDDVTGKEVTQDSYLRPKEAWVTTEKNPDDRKVVVRYDDPEQGVRDIAIPFTEHLRILNNVYGAKDSYKVSQAQGEVLKKLFGNLAPGYQQLRSNPMFSAPQPGAGAQQLQLQQQQRLEQEQAAQQGPPERGAGPWAPGENNTTGEFDFNATRRKQKK